MAGFKPKAKGRLMINFLNGRCCGRWYFNHEQKKMVAAVRHIESHYLWLLWTSVDSRSDQRFIGYIHRDNICGDIPNEGAD